MLEALPKSLQTDQVRHIEVQEYLPPAVVLHLEKAVCILAVAHVEERLHGEIRPLYIALVRFAKVAVVFLEKIVLPPVNITILALRLLLPASLYCPAACCQPSVAPLLHLRQIIDDGLHHTVVAYQRQQFADSVTHLYLLGRSACLLHPPPGAPGDVIFLLELVHHICISEEAARVLLFVPGGAGQFPHRYAQSCFHRGAATVHHLLDARAPQFTRRHRVRVVYEADSAGGTSQQLHLLGGPGTAKAGRCVVEAHAL